MYIKLGNMPKKRASATVYSLITLFFACTIYLLSYKLYLNTFYFKCDSEYSINNISCDIEKSISKSNEFFCNEDNKNKLLAIKNNKSNIFIINEYINIIYIHESDKYYLKYINGNKKAQVELQIKNINNTVVLIPKSKNEKIYNF